MEAGPRDNEETAVDDVERDGSVGGVGDLRGLDGRGAGTHHGNGGALTDGRPGEDVEGVDGIGRDDTADSPLDETPVEPQELRPPRKLRLWQIAPIVGLSALGSLMFAFPLAFEPGGGTGAVVSMLGLLICGCAAGWGVMTARRVGLTWPGLPARGSGDRPDWRVVLLYAVIVGTVVVLAIWRVARLR